MTVKGKCGYVIGSQRFREQHERALGRHATPRSRSLSREGPGAKLRGRLYELAWLHYRARMELLLIASAARVASLKADRVKVFTAPLPFCQARAAIGYDPIRAAQGSSST